jgi:hypothetical protein
MVEVNKPLPHRAAIGAASRPWTRPTSLAGTFKKTRPASAKLSPITLILACPSNRGEDS